MSKIKRRPLITPLDVARAKKVLNNTRPPVTREEAADQYIELWDMFSEVFERYEKASLRIPKLEQTVNYWKKKALKAQPRITPIKYD